MPLTARFDELELDTVDRTVESEAGPCTVTADHRGLQNDLGRFVAGQANVVDAVQDLKVSIDEKVRSQQVDQIVAMLPLGIDIARRDQIAKEPGIARLGCLLGRCDERANLRFGSLAATAGQYRGDRGPGRRTRATSESARRPGHPSQGGTRRRTGRDVDRHR